MSAHRSLRVSRKASIVHEMDDHDLESFLPVAERFGQERFGFVVTPNVDHLVRYSEDEVFRGHYKKRGLRAVG